MLFVPQFEKARLRVKYMDLSSFFCRYNIVQYKYTELSFSKNPQHIANTLGLQWICCFGCAVTSGENKQFEVYITDLPRWILYEVGRAIAGHN